MTGCVARPRAVCGGWSGWLLERLQDRCDLQDWASEIWCPIVRIRAIFRTQDFVGLSLSAGAFVSGCPPNCTKN